MDWKDWDSEPARASRQVAKRLADKRRMERICLVIGALGLLMIFGGFMFSSLSPHSAANRPHSLQSTEQEAMRRLATGEPAANDRRQMPPEIMIGFGGCFLLSLSFILARAASKCPMCGIRILPIYFPSGKIHCPHCGKTLPEETGKTANEREGML